MEKISAGKFHDGPHKMLSRRLLGPHCALCRARIRPPVELGKIVRAIGIARARFKIGMMNLGYNIRRLVQRPNSPLAPISPYLNMF
jgi:hypothetical protein